MSLQILRLKDLIIMGDGGQNFYGDVNAKNLQVVSAERIETVNYYAEGSAPAPRERAQIISSNDSVLSALKSLQGSALEGAEKALEEGDYNRAIQLYDKIVSDGVFQALSNQEKRTLFHYRCCSQLVLEKSELEDAIKSLLSVEDSFETSDLFYAWSDLCRYFNGESSLEYVKAQLPLSQTRPSMFEVALRSGDRESVETAKHCLLKKIRNCPESEIKSFSGVFYLLAGVCSSLGEPEEGLVAIRAMSVSSKLDEVRISTRELTLRIQSVTDKDLVRSGYHLGVPDWHEVCEIVESVDRILNDAYEFGLDVEKAELTGVKSLCFSLKGQHEKAISCVPQDMLSLLSDQALKNLCMAYQSLGDWSGIIEFIENLPPSQKSNLSNIQAVAYLNLGKTDLAERVPEVDGYVKNLIDYVKSGKDIEFNPDEKVGVFEEIQYLQNKYFSSKDESYLNEIKGICAVENEFKLCKADALHACGDEDYSLSTYKEVFDEVGPGLGRSFNTYLSILISREHRKSVNQFFINTPKLMIYESITLLGCYVNFIISSRSARYLTEFLADAIESNDSLSLKINWLYGASIDNRKKDMVERLKEWGLEHEGTGEEKAKFLRIAGALLGVDSVLPVIYKEFHHLPNCIDYLQAVFALVMNPKMLGQGRNSLGEEFDEVTNKSYVILSGGGEIRKVLIDFSMGESPSPWILREGDERAESLLGSKVEDKVFYEGKNFIVKKIYSPYRWISDHAMKELPKRPKKSHVFSFSGSSAEESANNIMEYIINERERINNAISSVSDGVGLVLARLGATSSNFVSLWLEYIFSEEVGDIKILSSTPKDLEGRQDLEFVFDCSSITTLGVASNGIYALSESGLRLALPHSLIDSFRRENSSFEVQSIVYVDCVGSDSNQDFNRRFQNFCLFVDSNAIGNIDPLPGEDIHNYYLDIIKNIPALDRDSILSAYGHENRVLVSDDSGIIFLANKLGVRAVTSFQALSFATREGSSSVEREFYELSFTNFSPVSTPIPVLSYIAAHGDQKKVREYFDKNLSNVSFNGNNISSLFGFSRYFTQKFPEYKNVENYEFIVKRILCDFEKDPFQGDNVVRQITLWFVRNRAALELSYIDIFYFITTLGFDLSQYIPLSNEQVLQCILRKQP